MTSSSMTETRSSRPRLRKVIWTTAMVQGAPRRAAEAAIHTALKGTNRSQLQRTTSPSSKSHPTLQPMPTSAIRSSYQVIDAPSSSSSPTPPLQQAYASTTTRYFNSKINVSNVQERILVTLLSGLTFKDLLTMTTNNSILGIPRDITLQSLHSFKNKYGQTPDILQLAFPDLGGNKRGYFAPKKKLTRFAHRSRLLRTRIQ
jgi:hypothetical protein